MLLPRFVKRLCLLQAQKRAGLTTFRPELQTDCSIEAVAQPCTIDFNSEVPSSIGDVVGPIGYWFEREATASVEFLALPNGCCREHETLTSVAASRGNWRTWRDADKCFGLKQFNLLRYYEPEIKRQQLNQPYDEEFLADLWVPQSIEQKPCGVAGH